MSRQYLLVNGEPILEPDFMRWAAQFNRNNDMRRVAETFLGHDGRRLAEDEERHAYLRISTVFLGIDYNFDESGPPILYETLAFACEPTRLLNHTSPYTSLDYSMRRYHTRDEALRGHELTVEIASTALRAHFVFIDDEGTHWPDEGDLSSD